MSEQTYTYTMEAPVDTPPKTVVSLVPSITESLFELNLGARVIGRTDYCVYPEAKVGAVPTLGGTKNPDIQHIIELQPELVMANYEENRKEDVEALRAAGIPVWVTFPQKVADVFVLLWNIMYLFDETTMVPRIRLMEQIYDRFLNLAESEEDTLPKIFVPIWYDPLMTANKETYLHDVLFICGGKNVFADRERRYPLAVDLGATMEVPAITDEDEATIRDTRYPRVTMAEVEAAQPDIILLPSEPFEFTEAHIALFQQLDVPAAKNKRIHLVDGSLLTWHGTRVAYAMDRLPTILRMT